MPRSAYLFRHRSWMLISSLIWLLTAAPAQAKFIAVSASFNDTFQNMILKGIEDEADRNGDDSYISYANMDKQRQLSQIREYVQAGADAIIAVTVDGNDEQHTQKMLAAAGKTPLVFINSEPFHDLKKLPKSSIYVGSNELDSGTMEMEELARLASYQGNVALLIGEPNHKAAKMRTQDVKDVLAKYPKMKLVASEVANWSRNEAYTITKKWLQQKLDFKVLVANNDEMAIGAILAFEDAGIDPKPYLIGGIDATPDALQMMDQQLLDVTVLQDADRQGEAAVEKAYQLIDKATLPPAYWVPFKLVTLHNYQQFK